MGFEPAFCWHEVVPLRDRQVVPGVLRTLCRPHGCHFGVESANRKASFQLCRPFGMRTSITNSSEYRILIHRRSSPFSPISHSIPIFLEGFGGAGFHAFRERQRILFVSNTNTSNR